MDAVKAFRDHALNPEHPAMRGSHENGDVFFQHREACNKVSVTSRSPVALTGAVITFRTTGTVAIPNPILPISASTCAKSLSSSAPAKYTVGIVPRTSRRCTSSNRSFSTPRKDSGVWACVNCLFSEYKYYVSFILLDSVGKGRR